MNKEEFKKNEFKKNPMSHFSDSVNHSETGDLNSLMNGKFITRIITVIIIAAILFFIQFFS